jgi:hypothetical protein
MSKIDIACKLNETLFVGLAEVRENIGHDDSIPYQAIVFIGEKSSPLQREIKFKKIATVCNSGWGGDSEIRITEDGDGVEKNTAHLERIKDECSKHEAYYMNAPLTKYSTRLLFDLMVENFLIIDEQSKKKTIGYRFDDDPAVRDSARNPLHMNCYIL